ncbi:hypothetical protein PspLS_11620 [Pyricularia sp. CBS 133598]|nr:hypothetical protein PspLS_11620 [Pyricularia sp. CBS 133598]
MTARKAIGLSCALGLGIVACGVAGYKATLLPILAHPDITCKENMPLYQFYLLLDLDNYSKAESAALLISSSIPFLTPIFRIIVEWIRGVKTAGRNCDMDSLPDFIHNQGHDRQLHRRDWDTESAIVLRSTPGHRQRSIRRPNPSGTGNARGSR